MSRYFPYRYIALNIAIYRHVETYLNEEKTEEIEEQKRRLKIARWRRRDTKRNLPFLLEQVHASIFASSLANVLSNLE